MNTYEEVSPIVVTCTQRLTPYLEKEISELGYHPEKVLKSAVQLSGTMSDCIKLNLNLRCGSQVMYKITSFQAKDADQLYTAVHDIPWEKILSMTSYVSVTSTVHTTAIDNNLYANVKVKDALVDRLRKVSGKRPDSGPDLSMAVVHLYWMDAEATLYLDTSGETLAKHGYRKIPGKAPMLESLAAATLLATNWNRESPFINPMCGSSTLAIEAAMLATNRKPGLLRTNYSFMHFDDYQPALYDQALESLKASVKEIPYLKIVATDISADSIKISKVNAIAAGVEKYIQFEQCDFALSDVPEDEEGVIFFNPEYGERLGDLKELEHTYARIGDFMKKKCQGYTGYIFTGNFELAKKIGLKADRRIEFYNGKIDCRLLEYSLYSGSKRSM